MTYTQRINKISDELIRDPIVISMFARSDHTTGCIELMSILSGSFSVLENHIDTLQPKSKFAMENALGRIISDLVRIQERCRENDLS